MINKMYNIFHFYTYIFILIVFLSEWVIENSNASLNLQNTRKISFKIRRRENMNNVNNGDETGVNNKVISYHSTQNSQNQCKSFF